MAQRQITRLQGIEAKGKSGKKVAWGPDLDSPLVSRGKIETTMSETDSAAAGRQEESESIPLPPATFSYLILSLRMQAEIHLGLLHFGEEKDQPGPDLGAARHAIDLLAMLQEKTKGNLALEEQRLVDNSLTELRFRYVQAVEASNRPKPS